MPARVKRCREDGHRGPWGRSHYERELCVEELTLLARPVPRRAEKGGTVHKQCTDPLVQGRPGPRSGARGRDGGPPREGEAGAEDESSLRDEGADHQPKPSGLGSVGRRAQVVESRPYRRHALGLGEDGGGKVRGEDE
jgi:hypothetical protein